MCTWPLDPSTMHCHQHCHHHHINFWNATEMKIVIVGAGITGLSTYLFLRQQLRLSSKRPGLEVYIYEAHDLSRYIDASTAGGSKAKARILTPHFTGVDDTKDESGEGEEETVFTPEAIGSAIGISKNGLDVMRRLEEGGVGRKVLNDMIVHGHPVNRWVMTNSRGWRLANVNLAKKNDKGEAEGDGGTFGIMISRQAMWSILLARVFELEAEGAERILCKKKVERVVIPAAEESPRSVEATATRLVFSDGSEEMADLVIGADGLRSVVRKCMFDPADNALLTDGVGDNGNTPPTTLLQRLFSWFPTPSQKPPTPKDYVTPQYEGLVGLGGFIPSSLLKSIEHEPATMGLVFGRNGFFGHGYVTTAPTNPFADPTTTSSDDDLLATANSRPEPGPVATYWSTFASPTTSNPFPISMSTSTTSRPKPYEFDREKALQDILERNKSWKNPAVQAVLKYIQETGNGVEGFYPTWTVPELPHWAQRSVVLVGDAAHAMQPSSGQGACQGMEDGEVLARLLGHYLNNDNNLNTNANTNDGRIEGEVKGIATSLQKYQQIRMPRVKQIYDRSQQMSRMKGDTGLMGEIMMFVIMKIIKLVGDGGYQERLMGWDLLAEVERAIKE